MVVALMGYMGSGKTTIGKALATLLNYNFLDLDDYISEQEQMSIPELFDKKGESDPAGARTQDPLLKREMLYQLSYGIERYK